jgi:hypothetical protein
MPGVCAAASDCLAFLPSGTGQHFSTTPSGGTWDTTDIQACSATPDRVSVKLQGDFHWLTNLIGHNTVRLTSITTLQFEPTIC